MPWLDGTDHLSTLWPALGAVGGDPLVVVGVFNSDCREPAFPSLARQSLGIGRAMTHCVGAVLFRPPVPFHGD
jgi:hypothetical protein